MKAEKLPTVDLQSVKRSHRSADGVDWKFWAIIAAVWGVFVLISAKLDIVVEAYKATYAENNTARTNIKALKTTPCWECHGVTGKFLPRRQYLSESQFVDYVRSKEARQNNDRGKMPEYSVEQISEEELRHMYIVLYSTLSRI